MHLPNIDESQPAYSEPPGRVFCLEPDAQSAPSFLRGAGCAYPCFHPRPPLALLRPLAPGAFCLRQPPEPNSTNASALMLHPSTAEVVFAGRLSAYKRRTPCQRVSPSRMRSQRLLRRSVNAGFPI
jgi:hypothetical protein